MTPHRRTKSKDFEIDEPEEAKRSDIRIDKPNKRIKNKPREKPGRAISTAAKQKQREPLMFLSSLGNDFLDLFARDNAFM